MQRSFFRCSVWNDKLKGTDKDVCLRVGHFFWFRLYSFWLMKSSESNIETIVCSQSERKTQIDFNEPHNKTKRNEMESSSVQFSVLQSQARINANFIQIKLKWIIQLNEREKGSSTYCAPLKENGLSCVMHSLRNIHWAHCWFSAQMLFHLINLARSLSCNLSLNRFKFLNHFQRCLQLGLCVRVYVCVCLFVCFFLFCCWRERATATVHFGVSPFWREVSEFLGSIVPEM